METSIKKHIKPLAILGILVATMIWGSSFVVMKTSVDLVPPTWLLAFRFTAASFFLVLFFQKNLRKINRQSLICGIILGLVLNLSYLFQTYGLKYTTASKNAFITTLYVILVPFLHWIFTKKRPEANHMAAAVIAVIGLALLSLQGDLTIQFGDFLTLLCGVSFAVHMVLIDRFTETIDPVILTVLQVVVSAVLNWILAPFMDGSIDFSVLANQSLILGILYLAVFCTMIGFLLQNIGQKYLNANTSAILLSLESVFGTLFSVWLLGEVLTGRMLTGCTLMFGAVILSEVKPGRKQKGT